MKYLKKHLLFPTLALLMLISGVNAQMMEPVKWSTSVKKTSNNEAELILTATMEEGWHLYSQDIPEGGPVPTEFSFKPNENYELTGKVIEPKPIEENDPNFKMILKFFDKKATFKQKIKIKSKQSFKIKGEVYFMCCDDKQCLPPNAVDVEFTIPVEPEKQTAQKEETTVKKTSEREVESMEQKSEKTETGEITESEEEMELPATKEVQEADLIAADSTEEFQDMSLFWFFLTALGAGFLAVLTPCIYPMIPMTVSFFMHEEKKKGKSLLKAFVFGISIIVIYVLIGSIVSITLGERFANFISTHWLPNIFFFILFIIFAASFLGMFEIVLPSWMVNRSDKQVEKGGLSGSFFMALTLVIVSFSCTAPIAGTILAFSAQGMVIKPVIGMLGYSLAFAIPFTIFAIIPSWLQKMPKSGGWLNSVKVVIGFIELALAFKFLSVADQTYHWGILDREIYIALWIVIFTLMGVYLLGKLKFSHDSDLKYLGVPRLGLAIVTFTFVVYLIPGMFGAPLKALAGWLPPQSTHDFDLNYIVRDNAYMVKDAIGENTVKYSEGQENELCEDPKYEDALHLPHHLKGYFDYDQAIECARAQKKPLFIDFTGHGCVNCREMEARVWSDSRVLQRLREDFVVVAMYVDDHKIKLPKDEWIVSKYDGKVKKTLGAKNWDFQKWKFNANAQPYYCILGDDENLLVSPRGYDLDVDEFVEFLDRGVDAYERKFK